MDQQLNKLTLTKLRDATDNACMLQTEASLKDFWEAYYAVKKIEEGL